MEPLGFYAKSVLCTAYFRLRRVQTTPWTFCTGRIPKLYTHGKVSIGGNLTVRGAVVALEIGAGPGGHLKVGNRVYINQGAVVVSFCEIEIGDDSMIGEYAAIYDTNHHPIDEVHPIRQAPVIIGKNVWLGRNVTVLPGSKIGDHTVVATGSVVKGELPPRVLAAGDPARPVREIQASEGWERGNQDGTHPVSRPAERTGAGPRERLS